MKRQRGRHNGRRPPQHHNPNVPIRGQTFDSSGPDVRIRGNAYQVLEKYLALARDAHSAGDRVAAENYYQHAEHYFRTINAAGEQNRPNFQQGGPPQPQHPQQGGQGAGDPRYGQQPQDPGQNGAPMAPGTGPQPAVVITQGTPQPGYPPQGGNPNDQGNG